jgi:putative chitinase
MQLSKLQNKIPAAVFTQLPDVINKFNISNSLRLAHFLAQCAHESGNFALVRENLNYSRDGLIKIFPKYFTPVLAESYARKPEAIASRVYASRMGNGAEPTRDGWTFRGRGYIQLTGKNNYTKFSEFIGEDCVANPDLVATKYPLASAAYFFNSNNLWTVCDKGATDAIVTSVSRRVNGGTIGLADRIKYFKEFHALLK